jgi:phage tail-like protein
MLERQDPLNAFNFHVEIGKLVIAGFSECTGLQAEIDTQPYSEGGVNDYEHNFWGRTKYPRLVLKRGLTQIDGLWEWYWEVMQGRIQRKNGTIYLRDSQKRSVMAWHFSQALPVKWAGPDLRADSATLAFETIELVHQGLRWEKQP